MKAPEHTPGPWAWSDRYEDEFGKGQMLLSNGGKGTYVCHVYTDVKGKAKSTTERWQATRKANGDLIADAPALAAALKDMCVAFGNAIPHPGMTDTAADVMTRATSLLKRHNY